MNKTAFRQKSGDWIYYLTWFTYKEVELYVKKIDDELHKSASLNDMIQRSLTDNVDRIANYIQKQEEHFFNALVLAVYDGDPQWREVVLNYGDDEKYDLGILILNGEEKIFPVDGQHRVEGIKKVLADNKDGKYDDETIPVILIGHRRDNNGMQRTRRLFSTLNRYAKPVTLNDIIALDEDDIIAIATRHLIENSPLFHEKRLNNHKQKAIPDSDRTAFTNIISLYECNTELLKYFIKDKKIVLDGKELKGKNKIIEYCRFRPDEAEIEEFLYFVDNFWNEFCKEMTVIRNYIAKDIKLNPASEYRNKNGGNLLFRPIGQRPFVKCVLSLLEKNNFNMEKAMQIMNKLELSIENEIWEYIAWNPISKRMIASSNGVIIELMMKYFVGIELPEKEMAKMINNYRSMKSNESLTNDDIVQLLNSKRV